jgi:hypothetical protein
MRGHHGHHHRHRHHEDLGGCGRHGCGFADRETWIARLESYQRDLEQRTADVADLLRRLRADAPGETPATV